MLVCAVCVAVMIVVSFLTTPPEPAKLLNTTVWSISGSDREHLRAAWYKDYRLWFGAVCTVTAVIWFIMR